VPGSNSQHRADSLPSCSQVQHQCTAPQRGWTTNLDQGLFWLRVGSARAGITLDVEPRLFYEG
jgi:hypothetical protein